MFTYEVLEGTPGLSINDVAHVMLPGRGRDATGNDLSQQTFNRVVIGAELFFDQRLEEKDGVIVCSGNKTPSDRNGERGWHPEDSNEQFIGVPEADSMRKVLRKLGIADSLIRVERHSIDTVTNFANTEAENHFGEGDKRPVAIIAQEQHLNRMIKKIAPRTLRRDFMGIIVPEIGEIDRDGRGALLASQVVLRGVDLYMSAEEVARKTQRNADQIWRVVLALQALSPFKTAYKTDTDEKAA